MSSPGIEPAREHGCPHGSRAHRGRRWNVGDVDVQKSVVEVPRQGIEPRPTASKAAMHPPHPQGNRVRTKPPKRGGQSHFRSEDCPKIGTVPGDFVRRRQYPDLDSNQGQDLQRVSCKPLHHRDVRKACENSPPFQGGAGGGSNRSVATFPSHSRPSPQHEREDSNLVRQFWRLTALPGARS